MSLDREIVLHWMRAQDSSPWRWTEDASVITWKEDGTTIVFREELEYLLEGLLSQGFPTLDAIVLVLATLAEPPEGGARRVLESGLARRLEAVEAAAPAMAPKLRALGRLPPGLTSGSEARRQLLAALFEGGTPRVRPGDAAEVLEMLRHSIEVIELERLADGSGHPALAVRELGEALERNPPDALERKLKTGFEFPVGPPRPRLLELFDRRLKHLGVSVPPRDLLDALAHEPRFAGLVQVARRVLAASSRRQRLREKSEQPMGGVSDVSNRGSPDRLLVSELAHDPDTFALRMANHEALYLRRERPPPDRPRDAIVLLDTGIHLWGLPRVFALAVALAMRELRRHEANFRLFVLRDGVFQEQALVTVSDVEAVLGVLDPSPWPAGAVVAQIEDTIDLTRVDEWTLITRRHRDEEIDALRQAIIGTGLKEFQFATVARTGEFRLRSLNFAGGRELARAHLALESLLNEPPAERKATFQPSSDAAVHRRRAFPLLYAQRPFPLPLHDSIRQECVGARPAVGAFGVTTWGTVLHWRQADPLGQVLAEGVPPLGRLAFSVPRGNELYFFGRQSGWVWTLFRVGIGGDLPLRRRTLRVPRSIGGFRRAFFFETALVLGFERGACAFSLEEGQALNELPLPPGWEQPWIEGKTVGPFRTLVFDGHRLGLTTVEAEPDFVPLWAQWTLREPEPRFRVRPIHPLLGRAETLANDGAGGLLIRRTGRPAKRLRILDDGKRATILLEDRPGLTAPGATWGFEAATAPGELERLPFARLELPNGNAAWYDRRGILTLQFADPTEPEWSILLAMGSPLAWRSDGTWFGNARLSPRRPEVKAAGELRLALRRWWGDVR